MLRGALVVAAGQQTQRREAFKPHYQIDHDRAVALFHGLMIIGQVIANIEQQRGNARIQIKIGCSQNHRHRLRMWQRKLTGAQLALTIDRRYPIPGIEQRCPRCVVQSLRGKIKSGLIFTLGGQRMDDGDHGLRLAFKVQSPRFKVLAYGDERSDINFGL